MQSNAQKGSLQDKFQGYGAAPSEALWGNIAGALDQKEKKRRGFIWWWVGGAMAAALTTIIVLNNYQTSEDPAPQKFDMNSVVSTIDNNDVQSNESIVDCEVSNDAIEQKEVLNIESNDERSGQELKEIVDDLPKIETKERSNVIVADEFAYLLPDVQIDEENIDPLKMSLISPVDLKLKDPGKPLYDIEKIPKIRKPWEFGFSLGYWHGLDMNLSSQDELTTTQDQGVPDFFNTEALSVEAPTDGTVQRNLNFRAYIGKYISGRWAIRGGLDFSRTSFTTSYPASFNYMTTKSGLSSLGIPLTIHFDPIQRERFKLRLGAGIVTELPIYEKTVESYATSEAIQKSFTFGYQGAVQGDLSVDFNLGKKIWLTAKPSYRWYFAQSVNSNYGLVRKNHWIGGFIGLRWVL